MTKNAKKMKKSKKTAFFLLKKREVRKPELGTPENATETQFSSRKTTPRFFWAPRGSLFFHFFCVFFHFFYVFFIFLRFLCDLKKRHFFHFFSLFLHVEKRPIRRFVVKKRLILPVPPMIFLSFFFIFF